ncbi:hypothetical protein CHS0354_003306 [Potamilus streckersoni]|uniref:Ras modification protein ERF4 n=1 Tax=Potamilus streckersoni TaxID=2493646 RepID=A0AAE0S5D0_9BIVA|nr:hypothetical protein CHS0354_003306 [Potamilus streckersoni]
MDDLSRIPVNHCAKVFIQRDYSEGTTVHFQEKFPQELEGKIEFENFITTIRKLNDMYSEAESLNSRTYCESCFACMTAYLSYICMNTHYEIMLKKIKRYIEDQNHTVYVPRGLLLVDPVERGLRVLEVCILNEVNGR